MRSDMDHTVLPANYTMPASTPQPQSITALWLVLIYRPTEGRRLSRPGWLVTYRNKVPPPGVELGHVTHPSTNQAQRRVTSLIRPTPLPLRHAATPHGNVLDGNTTVYLFTDLQPVYFLHSTITSVKCLRLSDVSVICRVTYF